MASRTRALWERSAVGRAPWRLFALGGFVILLAWRYVTPLALKPDTQPTSTSRDGERHEAAQTAFEPTDWDTGPVALIFLGALILLVISAFVLIAAYPKSLPDVGRTLRIDPPGPRLQTDAEGDMRRFRDEEEKRLNSYYWTDKQKGSVHIPINEAMKKLTQSGIAGFPKEHE